MPYIPTDTECSELNPGICGGKLDLTMIDNCESIHIDGVDDVTINQGVGIDLTDGVSAHDATGAEIPFEVDPEEIDKCDVGEHTVTYTAIGADERMLPSLCGENFVEMACSGLGMLITKRLVTIEQADPPTINGIGAETLSVDEPFDPMSGVTGVDDNGNPVDVTYNGKYTNSAEGDIASFETDLTDPLKSLKVNLEPIQDLHGYDSPWVGGAGKQLLPNRTGYSYNGITYTRNADGSVTVNGTATALSAYNLFQTSDVANLTPSETYHMRLVGYEGTDIRMQAYSNNSWVAETYGTDKSFTIPSDSTTNYVRLRVSEGTTIDNVTVYPMVSKTEITEYEPYENICPITGWTGCEVDVAGVNLWDEEWEGGTINSSGNNATDANRVRAKNNIPIVGGSTYYVKAPSNVTAYYYDEDGVYLTLASLGRDATFTPPTSASYMRFTMGSSGSPVTSITVGTFSINYPSTDHDYHAYGGAVYPVSWQTEAGTVYGGTVDLATGVLTVTKARPTYNDISAQIGFNDSGSYFYATISDKLVGNTNFISSTYQIVDVPSVNNLQDGQMKGHATTKAVYWKDSRYTSTSDFLTAMGNEQICYELATPITYQLTPQQIQTLYGRNNVWSEQGDVYVEFWKSIPQGEFSYPLDGVYYIKYHAEDECGNVNDSTRAILVGDIGARTVIYEDGTLIINELSEDIETNIETHGTATNVYDPLNSDGTNYVWTSQPQDLWHESSAVTRSIKRVEIGSPIRPTSIAYWFYVFMECEEIVGLSNIDTSRCTNMDYMFAYVGYNVYDGSAVPYLDLSTFDTSNVTSMKYMFNHLYGAKTIDISSWDTSAVEDMTFLFSYCNLTETIYASNNFVVPNPSQYGMFLDCNKLVGGQGTAYNDHLANFTTARYARIDNPPDEPGYFTATE